MPGILEFIKYYVSFDKNDKKYKKISIFAAYCD